MDCGEVVETGRHEELLARQGHYARLVSLQDQGR
jgi:ABC-type multidrug transport system fused ATPase/permease subunit